MAAPYAELLVLAEQGLREDAPAANAKAREHLLMLYRASHAACGRLHLDPGARRRGDPWNERDLEGLEWVCRLAAAGHAGAERLLDRVLRRWPGAACDPSGSGRLRSIARLHPKVARSLARCECLQDEPSLEALLGWLESGNTKQLASIASDIRELYTGAEQRPPGSREAMILLERISEPADGSMLPGDLIAEIAELRLQSGNASERVGALHLLERGAQLGSRRARDALWLERHAQAPDQSDFLRDWLARQPDPQQASNQQCMIVGMAIERGHAGSPPDPMAALRWYAPVFKLALPAENAGGGLDPGVCQQIAQAIDPVGSDAALALAWSERGLDLGNQNCFDVWLAAYAGGGAGIAADPEVALERARCFVASGTEHGPRDSLHAPRVLFNLATKILDGQGVPADPALAARWLQIGALLGYRAAQYALGELYTEGRGVERDPAAARAWIEKSAAQGYGPAKVALLG